MVNREQARDIDDAASDWAAKASRGLSGPEQATLDHWLEQDPRRLGAYVRAQAAWIHAERATALGPATGLPQTQGDEMAAPPGVAKRRTDRRVLIAGAGALAASAAGALFMLDRPRTIDSGVGEIRQLTLAGGSTLTLDTGTRVRIAHGSADRVLELAQGKVFLNVLSAARPLTLSVAGLDMRMAWGAFELEALAQSPLQALVTQGELLVSQNRALGAHARALALAANKALTLPIGADLQQAKIGPIDVDDVDKLMAWREGMLSFGNETLAAAVREFDRYGSVRIMVADPQLAQQRVTGLFKANDPKGFATAIAASFGAAVASDGDRLRIFIRK